tara:strand:+ start:281 stop:964 length:684 start_codon:yes stop_codon:yes gene_type:complete
MKPLIIIPARGGSKGVPKKNIKILGTQPLIKYTLDAAREVFSDKEICVSTDSLEIKEIVEGFGLKVPFLRPKTLALDISSTYDVLLHALNYYREEKQYYPDIVILLQITSPFRTGHQIKEALSLYEKSYDMVVSVKETSSNPYYVLFEENNDGWLIKSKEGNFIRRQDCPKVWEYNGAIYVINPKSLEKFPMHEFKKIKKYVMDEESSLDIDTQLDWKIAEAIINSN